MIALEPATGPARDRGIAPTHGVAALRRNRLDIVGVTSEPVFEAQGKDAQSGAIWPPPVRQCSPQRSALAGFLRSRGTDD
ncbi:hypothetical protein [Methylobacterium nonmethylotrophicum]|uniref:Uncharacterized protein n=1 Tax=Methylobacterium nonmethylotrophicum TaxID=1141884 RepID=A0A4Z0NKR9_9HYPH|nr:hypothetical protein [Methylobacterium nonmethylotrophicum]TGD96985.1 hypothetical protein EU555_21665 [Methylobacterium nonmethylotrophicum]